MKILSEYKFSKLLSYLALCSCFLTASHLKAQEVKQSDKVISYSKINPTTIELQLKDNHKLGLFILIGNDLGTIPFRRTGN
jgi:hypothetical protein